MRRVSLFFFVCCALFGLSSCALPANEAIPSWEGTADKQLNFKTASSEKMPLTIDGDSPIARFGESYNITGEYFGEIECNHHLWHVFLVLVNHEPSNIFDEGQRPIVLSQLVVHLANSEEKSWRNGDVHKYKEFRDIFDMFKSRFSVHSSDGEISLHATSGETWHVNVDGKY